MSNLTEWDILIVEDEYDSTEFFAQMLEYYGARVQVVHNGTEALSALKDFAPTVVITDLSMPEMDGWQTLAKIRQDATLRHLPVVAVTAYHSVHVAQDALLAGFNAYFSKPIDVDSFIPKLVDVVKHGVG